MGQYTSYYLYQRYEQREGQDPIPCTPNVYSVDGYGTMEKVIKMENDPDCGYTPEPTEPIYRWYQMPISEGYVCDECPELQYRWVESGTTCIGYDKWNRSIEQYSEDGGTTWNNTNPPVYSATSLIEADSQDCGYVPPTPPPTPPEGLLYKYWGCNGESSETLLTYDSVYDTTKQNYWYGSGNNKVYIGNAEDDYFGFIGDFVYQVVHEMLGSKRMAQLQYKSMTIPNNVFHISLPCLGSNIENIQLPNNLLELNVGISGNSITSGFTLPETLCTLNLGVKNSSNFKSIVIPKNVSRIGESVCTAGSSADVFNSDLESVTIKSLVPPYVGYWSQSKISSGLTIYVPTSAVNRYKEAWPNWSSHISGGVTTDDSFSDNYKYKVILNDGTERVIPISSSYLGTNDDTYDNVTSITIGDTVKYVDMNAFDDTYHGRNIVTLTLGRNVKVLTNSGGFEGDGLRNVTLNDGLIMIGNVFGRSLTSISLPSSLLVVGERSFEGCSGLTSINIPNSVKHIYDRAFENAGLTDVTIPSNVISLGVGTFRGCTNLSSVTLNNGLKLIDYQTFANCRGLSTITIPSSVKFVGGSAFSGCSNLTEVTFQSSEPPLLDNTQYSGGATTEKATTFDGLSTNYTIYVPSASVAAYKADRWFSQYSSRIQAIP